MDYKALPVRAAPQKVENLAVYAGADVKNLICIERPLIMGRAEHTANVARLYHAVVEIRRITETLVKRL